MNQFNNANRGIETISDQISHRQPKLQNLQEASKDLKGALSVHERLRGFLTTADCCPESLDCG